MAGQTVPRRQRCQRLTTCFEARFYTSPMNTQHPRIQLLTIEDLLGGKQIDMPAWRDLRTFKKAPKAKGAKKADAELF
jgi:hypothetical protein